MRTVTETPYLQGRWGIVPVSFGHQSRAFIDGFEQQQQTRALKCMGNLTEVALDESRVNPKLEKIHESF